MFLGNLLAGGIRQAGYDYPTENKQLMRQDRASTYLQGPLEWQNSAYFDQTFGHVSSETSSRELAPQRAPMDVM
jgi:hypothetical protein